MQWVFASFGGTVGSLVAFGINIHKTDSTGVSNAVYTIFIIIMCCSIVIAAAFIIDPVNVIRDDGTHIAIFKKATVMNEARALFDLFTDIKVLFLIPGIFVAEMCLALMSSINAYYFNLRTRSLNNVLFEFVMVPCPLALAWIMDTKYIKSRQNRGFVGLAILGSITIGALIGLTIWIKKNNVNRQTHPPPGVDWTDSAFGAGAILYILWGIIYATYQIVVQWVISALTNDPVRCARYAGLFKGTTSLGMCVSFILDSKNVTYLDQLIVQFVLYALGLACLAVVIKLWVKETNYFHEEDVIVPHKYEEKAAADGIVTEDQIQHELAKESIAAAGCIFKDDNEVHEREATFEHIAQV